jgi:hypothetical protein
MNWLRRFMIGRYGGDHLAIALILLSLLLTFIAQLTRLPILAYIGYIPLIISVFRMFSRNIEKRRMENYKFAMLMSPAYSWFNKMQRRAIDSKTHRYFKCPNCRSSLRVPKGKGKIAITCPKCRAEFRKKT